MPTTVRGIEYPEASDHTRLWEHFQTLAESTDAALSLLLGAGIRLQYQTGLTGTLIDDNRIDETVTFPEPFASIPLVIATLVDNGFEHYAPKVSNQTTDEFRIRVNAVSTFPGDRTFGYIAIGQSL